MGGDFGSGFMQGFAGTSMEMMRVIEARQQQVARQQMEKEKIKLLQQRLKGAEAAAALQAQEIKQRMQLKATEALQQAQQQQGRQEAGSATALLTESDEQRGFTLDPQTEAGLQGVITRQMMQEGQFTPVQKLMQAKQDHQRRQELSATLDQLLSDLPEQQQAFGRAALKAFTSGELTDDKLFAVFDRMAGSQSPSTLLALTFLAAGTGPRSEQARKAMSLLPAEVTRITTAQIAYAAAQGDEQAQAALKMLEQLRQTGVTKKEKEPRGKSFTDKRPTPSAPGTVPDPTFRGERYEGTGGGLPAVKSFRRVK